VGQRDSEGAATVVNGAVVRAGVSKAVQRRQQESKLVRWAEQTGVMRNDGMSQGVRKEKAIGIVCSGRVH
jgi:hypothetical protein